MSHVQASVAWVKQTFSWSNSVESWTERLVGAALILCAGGVWWLSGKLPVWLNLTLWAALAVTTAVLLRRGWLKLFGPVLFYDMLCTARRGRYFLVRSFYSMLLLLVLFSVYASVRPFMGRQSAREENAEIAMHFFESFTVVQLIAVVLLTPAYVAGSIAEEKERKTLEFLLATDLRNREIVLSKFGSRLGNLALFLLTGLPILSFLQFLGGVDPDLVLGSFAATALTAIGLASVGILASVLHKRPRDAIALTYLVTIAYIAIASVLFGFKMASFAVFLEPIWFGESPPTLGDAVEVLNAGNIFVVLGKVSEAGRLGTLATVIPVLLWRYFVFHGLVCVICLSWAIARLRVVALKQRFGRADKVRWYQRFRPPVGNLPVLWKELNIDGALRINWVGWIATLLLVLLTLGIGCWIALYFFWELFNNPNAWHNPNMWMFEGMNVWARIAGTAVACLTLLGVAVRASTTIRSEMDKDTFDALITTPLSADAILLGKFVGSLFSVRLGWFWLGAILGLAVVTGGLHVLALPLFLGAWTVYAVVFTMIGLWFSMICRSSMRATVFTLLTSIGLSVGHWLVTLMCCMPVFMFVGLDRGMDSTFQYLMMFQAGMTPPFVLGWFAYSPQSLSEHFGPHGEFAKATGFCLLGLFLWTMAGLMLWFVLIGPRFRHLTRRDQSSSEME